MRVKLSVVFYQPDSELWAFTVTDEHAQPLVRSASHGDAIGRTWAHMCRELRLLLGVDLVCVGSRHVRADERWDVSVREVGGRDEVPFRVS